MMLMSSPRLHHESGKDSDTASNAYPSFHGVCTPRRATAARPLTTTDPAEAVLDLGQDDQAVRSFIGGAVPNDQPSRCRHAAAGVIPAPSAMSRVGLKPARSSTQTPIGFWPSDPISWTQLRNGDIRESGVSSSLIARPASSSRWMTPYLA
jgi:hypothetical protein